MVLGLGPTTCTWSPEMFDIQNNRTFFDWTQYYAVYSIVAVLLFQVPSLMLMATSLSVLTCTTPPTANCPLPPSTSSPPYWLSATLVWDTTQKCMNKYNSRYVTRSIISVHTTYSRKGSVSHSRAYISSAVVGLQTYISVLCLRLCSREPIWRTGCAGWNIKFLNDKNRGQLAVGGVVQVNTLSEVAMSISEGTWKSKRQQQWSTLHNTVFNQKMFD